MMRRLLWVFAAVAVFNISCPATTLVAAPPDVKYLNPSGAQSGRETKVTASGTFAKWPVQVWVSGEGVRFEPETKSGRFVVHVDADVPPGVRWVRFISDEGSSLPKAFLIGAIAESVEAEPNDSRSKVKAGVTMPTVVNGALGTKGDVDQFRVVLKKGQTLVAAVDAYAAFGSAIDCALQLSDADGHVLAQNVDERGYDPRIIFVAPRDDDFYVRLFGIASVPNSSISFAGADDAVYRLTLTTDAYVDRAWPIVVPIGGEAKVALEGWNLPAATPAVVRTDDLTSPVRAAVPLAAAGRASVIGVDVQPVIETESDAAAAKPRALVPPSVVGGRFERPGDRDEYVIQAKKGDSYRIRVTCQAFGFPSDPLVTIFKPYDVGPQRLDDLARADFDVDNVMACPVSGEYRFAVEDLYGNGGPNYAYVFDIRPVAADFALSVTASEINAPLGKPFELTVNVDRPLGNASDIEIRLEGVPEKFGAAPVVSGGDKTAIKTTGKQVKLKFTPTEKFDGPVRVVGVIKGEPEVRRAATAAVAVVPGAKITDFWLHAGNVPPPAKPAAKK